MVKSSASRSDSQLEKELGLITVLGFTGYFLLVWDIVRFCKERHPGPGPGQRGQLGSLLLPGNHGGRSHRIPAALRAVPQREPLRHQRRAQSMAGHRSGPAERRAAGESHPGNVPPLRSQRRGHDGQRHHVQGPEHHARDRQGAQPTHRRAGPILQSFPRGDYPHTIELGDQFRKSGLDQSHPRAQACLELFQAVHGLPRHLGQHSGGMVFCQGHLDSVVHLENCSMPDRSIIAWDKDDCEELGLVKVDLLGLGMMAAIQDTLEVCRPGAGVDLAHLPKDDAPTYDAMCASDTIGVFQVESRAQMATLARLQPRCFYDVVVQVAMVRPGPIEGGLMHPYLARRQGWNRSPIWTNGCVQS